MSEGVYFSGLSYAPFTIFLYFSLCIPCITFVIFRFKSAWVTPTEKKNETKSH